MESIGKALPWVAFWMMWAVIAAFVSVYESAPVPLHTIECPAGYSPTYYRTGSTIAECVKLKG